jgi:mono/diheme cytochrome c family protein
LFQEHRTMKIARLPLALALVAGAASLAFAQTAKSVWTGVYTAEQATRGAEMYTTSCADCHGDDLEGRERAPALAGGDFAQRWDGATLKKLFERLEEMPPDDPQSRLAGKEYADILAYLLRANKIPAGTVALTSDKDALAGLVYTSQRPKF